ncbi:MAG: Hsp70 family protein, partial [Firmicutes bacterium]|nr:Hsp70 family protein [Bacillota bacterium]
ARRGIPQIEVTFDIDANGIVNVSAKDLGTGKEQKITITSSTKLSEDEINQKVREAEQYAAEDKIRKESVELQNQAESLVYQTENTLKDIDGKIAEEDKTALEGLKNDLQSAISANNPDDIRAKMEALTTKFNEVSTKLYQQAGAQAGAEGQGFDPNQGQGFGGATEGPAPGTHPDDNVVDADYTVVDEDTPTENN